MPDPLQEPEGNRFLLEHKPFWREFLAQVKDLVAPEKQPELVLESKPIPVKDIWSPPKPLRTRLGSVVVHVVVIALLMLPLWQPVRTQVKKVIATAIYEPVQPDQPQLPRMRHLAGGGAPVQLAPKLVQAPKVQPIAAPTALVPLAQAISASTFGSIGPISGPPGAGGGTGGGGDGGTGSGMGGGDCTGANCGGGTGVTEPILIYDPDPQYSDAARKAKFQGSCIIQVVVGADGRVRDPHVVQPLGLGLDQKAIQAVLQWRFRPARDKNGHPVAVTANIQVNFRLY